MYMITHHKMVKFALNSRYLNKIKIIIVINFKEQQLQYTGQKIFIHRANLYANFGFQKTNPIKLLLQLLKKRT